MQEFHAGDCGGHLYWKPTTNKILRASFYQPTLFANVKKHVTSYHKCQIFDGKRKLLPLPLKPISTQIPFQQWRLDFIGEIHLVSLAHHKWILTATDYFTKSIEAIPSRQATNTVIISFLESNILLLAYMGLTQVQKSYLAKQIPQLPALSTTTCKARTEVSPKVAGEGVGTRFPPLGCLDVIQGFTCHSVALCYSASAYIRNNATPQYLLLMSCYRSDLIFTIFKQTFNRDKHCTHPEKLQICINS